MLNKLHVGVKISSTTLVMNARLLHYTYKGIHYDSKVFCLMLMTIYERMFFTYTYCHFYFYHLKLKVYCWILPK
jgi:hypothetical protein